jgi:hypothetical protein
MSAYILWHNGASNEMQMWFMNWERIIRRATVLDEHGQTAIVGPPFRIVATRNGHILWHHDTTGETQFWIMFGETLLRRATVLDENGQPSFIGPPFHIVGAGATGPEEGNQTCIIWYHNTTGETQIWSMSNEEPSDKNIERLSLRRTVLDEAGQPIFVGPPFRIVGTYDQSIFWHHDITGETQIWTMFGENIIRRSTVLDENGHLSFIGPPFRIVGVADIKLQGIGADIIWYHDTTHETQIWFMDGARLVRRATVVLEETGQPFLVGPPWRIVASGNSPLAFC